jgi:hypothetical protein
MKFTFLLLFLCCFFSLAALAQNNYSIKGEITDTSAKVKLANTSIIVLNAKDSILRAFTRTGPNGSFSINNLSKGKYILLVTYPDYADYVEQFTLDSAKSTHDFGSLNMILKAKLLAEVLVKGQVTAIKIKGDTTEYNAKAYVIQPNDKVEDLLRQLPGIEVDKDGKITAQGETVNKVLVDGEEFFGDDPTLVTRNLRADMVDKVQVYDKKSDQAAFTGIDDGVKIKTINIKLKEDKKNGLFGSVNGNVGTNDYYEGQLQFNRFRANEKFAVYGTAANDGRTGLGFQDASNLGVGNNNIQFVDGGISITNSGSNDALDSFSGYYDGKGVPVTQSGGAHYDSKWNDDKESINTNYKIGAIDVTGVTTTTTQQTLPTGTINTTGNQTFNNSAFRQKLDATYQIKLDTSSNLKVSADGTNKTFSVDNDYYTKTDTNGTLLNTNNRTVINHGDQKLFDASALYTKKFKKVGRTLSWSLSETYNQSKTNGTLNSETDFYGAAGVKDSTETINQYKTTNTLSSVLNSNITYSEPITKKIAVLFNYGFAINNSTTDMQSFNQSAPGVYNVLDSAYSNDYKFNQLTNQVGAIINYKNNKNTFNFGTKVSAVNFKQVDEYTGDVLQRNFINWAPQAMYQYKFSQLQAFTVNYYGNTTQPTISQIQPVLVNTDPLNITIGNPDLKPSFTNRFNMFYNSYQVLSGQQLFLRGNFSNTYNAIVNNTVTAATGANTTQYVNLHNEDPYNYSVYASMGKKIKPVDLQVGLNLNTSGNISYSYIDNELDMARSHTYAAGLSLSKYIQKKYDFFINAGPSYTFSSMSLQPLTNNNAAGFSTSGRFDLYLPLNFGTGSDVNYTYTAQTQAFSAEYKTIWNAYIYKTFLKDDKLKLSLSVNDILNQNTNFSRGISGNTITQTNTSGIRRFFMFSVTWDFTKFGTIPAKN